MKNYSDITEKRTRDLPACSAVPHRIASPRVPYRRGSHCVNQLLSGSRMFCSFYMHTRTYTHTKQVNHPVGSTTSCFWGPVVGSSPRHCLTSLTRFWSTSVAKDEVKISPEINPLTLELDIYSLAHHLCKMWILYEPRRVTLGNTRLFGGNKRRWWEKV